MRGKIKNGLELVEEIVSGPVERVQHGETEDGNLDCVQQIARYAEQVLVEFNETHFRRPGGKSELRCEAEPDCVGEVVITMCVCLVAVGLVIWIVIRIRRTNLWRLGLVRDEYIRSRDARVVTERIAIRRVESVGVDAVRDSSNVPPEEMFVAAGLKYNQFGLRKNDRFKLVVDVATQTEKGAMGIGQQVEDGILASLERKVRERNGCYLFRGIDHEFNGGQRFSPGSVISRDVGLPDEGPPINGGEQSFPGRAFNQETVLPDVGPVISSPDDSEADDLNSTVREQNVDDQKERNVNDRIDAGMVPGVTAGEAIKPISKSGASKKKRKSQLELLGMCTNYTVKSLVLRSGKTLVGSDTSVVAEDDADKDATEDDCCLSDDEAEL